MYFLTHLPNNFPVFCLVFFFWCFRVHYFIVCFCHLLSGHISSHSSSGVNGDASTSKSHTPLANGYICRDCSLHSDKSDSYITRSSSSQAAELSSDVPSASFSPISSVYTRDRSRKNKTGEKFLPLWNSVFCYKIKNMLLHSYYGKTVINSYVSHQVSWCQCVIRVCATVNKPWHPLCP